MRQVVESAVTIPLEQQINGVEGMHYITSTSSNDGTSNINVVFRTGYDLNIAAVDVQNRVATATGPPAAGNQEHGHHHHQGEPELTFSRPASTRPMAASPTSTSRTTLTCT